MGKYSMIDDKEILLSIRNGVESNESKLRHISKEVDKLDAHMKNIERELHWIREYNEKIKFYLFCLLVVVILVLLMERGSEYWNSFLSTLKYIFAVS